MFTKQNMCNTVMISKMAYLFIMVFFIKDIMCSEGNGVRDQRANLAPASGGYGPSDMDDNYDYILDDTPQRGKSMNVNLLIIFLFLYKFIPHHFCHCL